MFKGVLTIQAALEVSGLKRAVVQLYLLFLLPLLTLRVTGRRRNVNLERFLSRGWDRRRSARAGSHSFFYTKSAQSRPSLSVPSATP